MTRRFLSHAFILALVAAVFLMSSASQPQYDAHAVDKGSPAKRDWQTLDQNGKYTHCADLPGVKGGVILGYIVPCISQTIENTTIRFSKAMIDWLRPTIYAFITLVVVLFGVRVLQGGGEPHKEGILLLLKIGLVMGILELIPNYFVPALYDVMAETQAVVAQAVGPDVKSIHCDINSYGNGQTALVWQQMDCLLGKLYGITTGSSSTPGGKDRPNMLLGASIFGLLGGFFFNGTFGATLFITLVGVLWTMFMIVVKTASAFLNAYLYASLMLIISPLMLPLVLLRVTNTYFDPWWKGILASVLMPLMITAYAMFAMLLYDKMMFADDSILQQLFNNDLVKKIQEQPRPVCNKQSTGNPAFRSQVTGIAEKSIYASPFMKLFGNELLNGSQDQCMGLMKPAVDITKLDLNSKMSNGQTPREIFIGMFMNAIKLFVLSILVYTGFNNVQSLARQLVGSSSVVGLLEPKGEVENKIIGMQGRARSNFMRIWGKEDKNHNPIEGKVSGVDFLTRVTEIPKRMSGLGDQ